MAGATIDGIPFHVNPSGISWHYTVKIASEKTIGGKVVQLLGMNMGDLIVRGWIGGQAIERQRAFFNQLKAIADRQTPKADARATQPVKFRWPDRGWDFDVFLRNFQQVGAGTSIERNARIFNPQYTLTMFVYEDNGNIRQLYETSAQAKYLARISAGLGWSQSKYNGPEGLKQLQEKLGGSSLFDYAFTQYGLTGSPAGAPVTSIPGGGGGGGGNLVQ